MNSHDKNKIKVALICFDNPFLKPVEGGKKGMMSRIDSLIYLNKYDIDLYLMNKQCEGVAKIPLNIKENFSSIYQYKMNSSFKFCFGKYPICVSKRFVSECISDLSKVYYDVVIYEGAQVAAYRLENKVNAKFHILYLHDIESEYRQQIAKSLTNPLLKFVNYLESVRFKMIENRINKFFDQFWFISSDECQKLGNSLLDKEKCYYFPFPSITFNDSICGREHSHRMLYVGDMMLKHNVLSMISFAENVFPEIKKADNSAELVLVGRISIKHQKYLESLGVIVKGYVDDLFDEYNRSCCFVCPVLFGAGVKVKTLDALAMGQIVITNKKGVEGTELKNGIHLLVEDDFSRLAKICIDVLKNRNKYISMAKTGNDFVKKYHCIEYQAHLIDNCLNKLVD